MSISRSYESTYIANAALEDGEVDALVARVNDFITEHGGQIIEVNKWGRRRLAYPVAKKYNGFYVYMAYEAPAEIIPQLERFFILEESVIRHLTLQLDMKLREFRKHRAEAQAARAAQLAAEGGEGADMDGGDRRRRNREENEAKEGAN